MTLTINIPWPYVTVGGTPVHVYDASEVAIVQNGECFEPPDDALAVSHHRITLDDWVAGTAGCEDATGQDPATFAGVCSFDVVTTYPESGQLYVNVHLDYGRKGPHVDLVDNSTGVVGPDTLPDRYEIGAPDDWSNDADLLGSAIVEIANCTSYLFSHVGSDDDENDGQDTVENNNVFKRIAGAMFLAHHSVTGDPMVEGEFLQLIQDETGDVVKTGTVDEDGFGPLLYKHKGKAEPYTVILGSGANMKTFPVMLKSNGWVYVYYNPDTDSYTVESGPGNVGGGQKPKSADVVDGGDDTDSSGIETVSRN